MAAKNVTFRLRDFEVEQVDELAAELGYSSRADVLRAAIQLLRSPQAREYREARRTESAAVNLVDALRREYGSQGRFEVESIGDRRVELTFEGSPPPEGLRAELVEIEGHEAGALTLIADSSLTGEAGDLHLSPGIGLEWDDWQEGTTSITLTSLYPSVGPDGTRTPLKDPAY